MVPKARFWAEEDLYFISSEVEVDLFTVFLAPKSFSLAVGYHKFFGRCNSNFFNKRSFKGRSNSLLGSNTFSISNFKKNSDY